MKRIRTRGHYKDNPKQGFYTRLAPDLIDRMRQLATLRRASHNRLPAAQQIDQALREYLDKMEPYYARADADFRRRATRRARRESKGDPE